MQIDLTGRVALISGGSRGIGAATVRMFAAAGAQVVFNYVAAQAAAEALVAKVGAERCHAVRCDLSSAAASQELVLAAVARFGRLDVLVGNHGIWVAEDVAIDEMSDEQWRRTMAVNVESVFGLIKYSVAQMKRQARSPASNAASPSFGVRTSTRGNSPASRMSRQAGAGLSTFVSPARLARRSPAATVGSGVSRHVKKTLAAEKTSSGRASRSCAVRWALAPAATLIRF